jgi:hypothetical protein
VKSVDDILARVDAEVSAGRVWRAKEILRGAIADRAEPAFLERYGLLLEGLGEHVEAGKYLFLSGARIPEYAEAIGLFRQRHAKLHGEGLAAQFPAAVRRLGFDELPPTLQRDLRELGVGARAFDRKPRRPRAEATGFARLIDGVVIAGALAVVLIFVVALAVGIWVIGRWLWTLFG